MKATKKVIFNIGIYFFATLLGISASLPINKPSGNLITATSTVFAEESDPCANGSCEITEEEIDEFEEMFPPED